jgi:hypothetical protein
VTEPTSPDATEQDIGDLDNETIFDPAGVMPAEVDHHGSESARDPFFATAEGRDWLTERGED